MYGKNLHLLHHVKYLGVYLDEYLNWGTQPLGIHEARLFRKMKIIKFVDLDQLKNASS